jgi:predicted anti-sigma-YlaC factor YlaD
MTALTAVFVATLWTGAPVRPAAQDLAQTANPELVGDLAKELNATPKQAEGAAGALFSAAKSTLAPADWTKVAAAVPGMDGLLKAAPDMTAAVGTSGAGALGAAAAAAGGAGKSIGGLASAASAFSKLGLKPELAKKAVPVLTKFVTKSGGADVAKLLAGALK